MGTYSWPPPETFTWPRAADATEGFLRSGFVGIRADGFSEMVAAWQRYEYQQYLASKACDRAEY
jgi:hypothetical protein